MRLFASCLAAIGLQSAVSVSFACEGIVSILRISNYVEGGTESGVRAASDQHNAWYRERGATENLQIVVPMLDYDADADAIVDDTSRVATLHINAPAGAVTDPFKGDTDWQAFVEQYSNNTDVSDTYFLCLPDEVIKRD